MNIKELSLNTYKRNLGKTMPFVMLYGFFIIITLALGYFLPPTLILTVPFVIIPFTFALQITITHINNNFPDLFKIFFIGYRMYFSPKGFGCYKSLQGFLKALGVFVGLEFLIEFVGLAIFVNHDTQLAEIINSITSSEFNYELYLSQLDLLMANNTFSNILIVATLVAMLFAFYMFAHHIFSHGMKANMVMYNQSPAFSMAMYNAIHKQFFRNIRKQYYKDYYSTIWLIIPLYVVFYCGGAALAYFVIRNGNFIQYQLIALAVAFLAVMPLLPLVCNLMENLYKKYTPRYNELSAQSVKSSFEELLKSGKLNEEQQKAAQEIIDKVNADQKEKDEDKEK